MKIIILFLLIGLNFLIIGCSNSTSPSKTDLTINDFPTKKGTYWVYKINDLVKKTSNNLTVSILGNATLSNNKLASIWEYKYSDHIDTSFVAINGDTLLFYAKTITEFYEQSRFVFPLKLGISWNTQIGDAVVTSVEYVPNSTFISFYSYKVTIYPDGPNTGGKEQYFISPEFGIVKFDNSICETDILARPHTVWELMYFHRGY